MAEQIRSLGSGSKIIRTGPIANYPSIRSGTKPGDRLRAVSRANYEPEFETVSRRASLNAELASGNSGDPMPLFLAGDADHDVIKAGQPWKSNRSKAKKWSAITKMTLMALIVIAIAVPLVLSKSSNVPLASATASQIIPSTQTETSASVSIQLEKPLPAVAEQEVLGTKTSMIGPSPVPTRDEIIAAYKFAVPIQTGASPLLATEQRPGRLIDREELANLLKRGRYLISVGDIASARLLLERAADAREPSAAFALAGTYDPLVLGRSRALGIAPDLAIARIWYERAVNFGSLEAQQRLAQFEK
jgi:hypothetical protein